MVAVPVVSAETDQRGYVISGLPQFAERVTAARPLVELSHVAGAVADDGHGGRVEIGDQDLAEAVRRPPLGLEQYRLGLDMQTTLRALVREAARVGNPYIRRSPPTVGRRQVYVNPRNAIRGT